MAEACDFADAIMIRRLCEKKGWRKKGDLHAAIEKATGNKVSEPTIKRALKGDPLTADILTKIAGALDVPPWVVTIPRNQKGDSYTWEHLIAGARKVAKAAFKRPAVDAILTYPAASSIFAGLVLVSLRDPKKFLRVPVYTALLKCLEEKCTDFDGGFKGFRVAKTKRYQILVPEALFQNGYKRIVVIDDTSLSGGSMDAVRHELLEPHFGKGKVRFATCICHESLTFGNRTAPEIIGLPQLETRKNFVLPYRIDAFRFEEGFPSPQRPRGQRSRKP